MNRWRLKETCLQSWPILAALVAAGWLLEAPSAIALSYSALPITAVVVDGETRQALEGVNAVVVWELQNSDGGGGPFWIFEETITDKEGRFKFSGWGPKQVPRRLGDPVWRLGPDQPVIYLFKSGYPFSTMSNPWESWMLGNSTWSGDAIRSSVWNSKTIELRRFVGAERQYMDQLSLVTGGLPLQGCGWAKIPRLTAALVVERRNRITPPMTSSLPTIQDLEFQAKGEKGCPPPAVTLSPFIK